jgi:dTDP-4-amino-4,6-dideoxygalactose transaminase
MIKPFEEPIFVTRPLLPPLAEFTAELEKIWDARWLTNNGRQHQLLEARLQDYLKVPKVSLFNNGTIALLVALQSLQLKGEVITTPFTFPATPHTLTWNNIQPVFCDICDFDMNIDANKIEALITPATSGILGVHVFGNLCNVERIASIAAQYDLKVIYDAAHAFGVEHNSRGVGSFGDVSMFSFHATKHFHTAEGGALAFHTDDQKNYIDLLKNFGIRNEEEVIAPGINGKMNEIQAALGLILLNHIEKDRRKRQSLCKAYKEGLADVVGVRIPHEIAGVKYNFQYFPIRIQPEAFGKTRDEVYLELKGYNIFARKYFHPLCSTYHHYSCLPSASPKELPVANLVASEVLVLPLYSGLKIEYVGRICEIIKTLAGC